MTIPTTIDAISPAILSGALQASGFAVGDGFLGELARLTIEYAAGSGPTSRSFPSCRCERPRRITMAAIRTPARTASFSRMSVRSPRVTSTAGGTLEQAQTAVMAAAGIHSRWWGKVDELEWVPPMDSPLNLNLGSFIPHVNDLLTAYGRQSRTLVHNDFRLDNMFFDESENGDCELVLLDWQVIGRGDGMGDLCPFLSSNFDSPWRREHELDLLRMHHDAMANAGAGYLEFDDLVTSYRASLNFWLANWCNVAVSKGETTRRGRSRSISSPTTVSTSSRALASSEVAIAAD